MGIPEREERGIESLLKEILAENFLKLDRKMGIQIFEGHDPKQVELEQGYPETCYNQSKVKNKEFGKQQERRRTSLMAQTVKNSPVIQETQVQSLAQEDALEKEMATHSSTLAWRIPMDRGA